MNPISQSGAAFATQWAVSVQKKQMDSAEDQGKAAVALIESSGAPAKATSGNVGTKLNVVA